MVVSVNSGISCASVVTGTPSSGAFDTTASVSSRIRAFDNRPADIHALFLIPRPKSLHAAAGRVQMGKDQRVRSRPRPEAGDHLLRCCPYRYRCGIPSIISADRHPPRLVIPSAAGSARYPAIATAITAAMPAAPANGSAQKCETMTRRQTCGINPGIGLRDADLERERV